MTVLNEEEREFAIEAIRNKIEDIYEDLEEMKGYLKELDEDVYTRAKYYWLAHIDGALLNREGFLGTSFVSALDTLEELERLGENE